MSEPHDKQEREAQQYEPQRFESPEDEPQQYEPQRFESPEDEPQQYEPQRFESPEDEPQEPEVEAKKSSYKGKRGKLWTKIENDALFNHIREWKQGSEGNINASDGSIANLMVEKMKGSGYDRSARAIMHRIREHNEDGERTIDTSYYRKRKAAEQAKNESGGEAAEQPKKHRTTKPKVSSAQEGSARINWKKKSAALEKQVNELKQEISGLHEYLRERVVEIRTYKQMVYEVDEKIRLLQGRTDESDEEQFDEEQFDDEQLDEEQFDDEQLDEEQFDDKQLDEEQFDDIEE